MRVCLEATSMIGPRSGVGHTTAELASALVECDDEVEVVLLPVSVRGAARLAAAAPRHPRIRALATRIPARLAWSVWQRSSWPPAELFCGGVDVFHGPNFVLPPLLKAAGVVTVHDLAYERMPEACTPHVRTYARTVPVALERAARVIVPSRFTAAEVAERYPEAASRVRVVAPGVRAAFAAPGGPLTTPRMSELGVREPYVVFVGNLEARKNLDVLLRAFGRVRPGPQLVLVGAPGPGWEAIADAHAELLASASVVRAGYLPDGEVAALVRGASAFVYPSRYEGFGMPPLEAMACGTPVVATKIGALTESLGDLAAFVHSDDPDELAAALDRLIEGPPEPGLVERARAWAAAFTWRRAAAETLAVYAEAVEDRR